MRSVPVHAGQLWRYLKAGLVNTVFGYALYALLLALGLRMFVAQIVATIIAISFNYFSYSRYVFAGQRPAKLRFLLSYGSNYLIGLAALTVSAAIVPSAYLAGLLAMLTAAAVNFVVLRHYVFVPSRETRLSETRPSIEPMHHAS